jgi:hypothetical protein
MEILRESFRDIQYTLQVDSVPFIQEFMIRIFQTIEKKKEFWRLFYALRAQPYVMKLLEKEFSEIQELIFNTLSSKLSFEGKKDPANLALVLMALIDGLCIQFVSYPGSYPKKEITEQIRKIYESIV